jgi:hypothetical protein
MTKQAKGQTPLFDTSTYYQKPDPKPPLWYYLTDGRGEHMVIGYDAYGKPLWDVHDLQHTIPHVYNNIRTAKADALRHGKLKVQACRYVIQDGTWVSHKSETGK